MNVSKVIQLDDSLEGSVYAKENL